MATASGYIPPASLIGPLELAQQAIALLHGSVERGLRRLLAGKGLPQLFLDGVTDQHE